MLWFAIQFAAIIAINIALAGLMLSPVLWLMSRFSFKPRQAFRVW